MTIPDEREMNMDTYYEVHYGSINGDIDVDRFDNEADAYRLFTELVWERHRDWRIWITKTTTEIVTRGRGVAA